MKKQLFKRLQEKLAALRPTKPLLVCETDGFSLRAAVLARTKGETQILYAAQSRQGDMSKALAEVVATLEKQGWQPGGKALLLSPDVVTALLELPADPVKPKPLGQMLELVRWEMEPLMMQQGAVWSVGSILVGMGYLNEVQARDIIKEQQLRSRRPSGNDTHLNFDPNVLEVKSQFKRFGDLAVELGYISQEQLDECLARQGHLKVDDDDYLFGWSPQAGSSPREDTDTFLWLASGVSKRFLRQWQQTFSEYGISLDILYPSVGCATVLLPKLEEDALLLEVNGGMAVGMRIASGRVLALNTRHSVLHGILESCLESWEALLPREGEPIWLAENSHGAEKLAESLHAVLDREVQAIPSFNFGTNGNALTIGSGMVGAAFHAWRLTGSGLISGVAVNGPQPPFWQRREVRMGAASLAALVLILAMEVSLQVRTYLHESELEALNLKFKQSSDAANKVKSQIDAVNKIKVELDAKEKALEAIDRQLQLVKSDLPGRNALVRGFLDDLDKLLPDDVVIDSIQEIPGVGFRVSAWAISDSSAQRFVKNFADFVRQWNQRVVDVSVDSMSGRLGMQGYQLKFRVFAVPEEEDGASQMAKGGAESKGSEKGAL